MTDSGDYYIGELLISEVIGKIISTVLCCIVY